MALQTVLTYWIVWIPAIHSFSLATSTSNKTKTRIFLISTFNLMHSMERAHGLMLGHKNRFFLRKLKFQVHLSSSPEPELTKKICRRSKIWVLLFGFFMRTKTQLMAHAIDMYLHTWKRSFDGGRLWRLQGQTGLSAQLRELYHIKRLYSAV